MSELPDESFEEVFRRYFPDLCDFVNGYVHSREVARDLVQDLFLNLWERHEGGTAPELTAGYLYTAARNRALNHIRHQGVVSRWRKRAKAMPAPRSPAADEELLEGELARAIEAAIAQLPERRREIFLMSREQDLSYADIAEILGISIKTVETQMWRALRSLRESLLPYLAITAIAGAEWVARLLYA